MQGRNLQTKLVVIVPGTSRHDNSDQSLWTQSKVAAKQTKDILRKVNTDNIYFKTYLILNCILQLESLYKVVAKNRNPSIVLLHSPGFA
jgi:hypothetical protein